MVTETEILPEQEKLIDTIVRNEGFVDFTKEFTSGSAKGENYLSSVFLLTVKERNIGKTLDLIVKAASQNEQLRNVTPVITDGFSREVYLYEKVLPALLEFQEKHNIPNKFETLAKEYGSDLTYPREIIVMENLKTSGFSMCDRRVTMNEEHISLVLEQYGKLHAISLAMSELEPEKFQLLTENMQNFFIPDTKEVLDASATFTADIMDAAEKTLEGFEAELAAFKQFRDTLNDLLLNVLSQSSKDDIVVTHGDCWCNNMMFKYEDPGNPTKPTKVCLIDWQLSRKGSPVLDLSYFLYSSASGKQLSRNIDDYLKKYHEVLSRNLKAYGCEVEKLFPYAALEEHWRKYSKFGLYMIVMIMKMLVHEPEEAINLEDCLGGASYGNMKNQDLYIERMRDIVCFMTDRKYI